MRDHTYKIVNTLYMTVQVLQQLGKSFAYIYMYYWYAIKILTCTYGTTKIEPPQIITIPHIEVESFIFKHFGVFSLEQPKKF